MLCTLGDRSVVTRPTPPARTRVAEGTELADRILAVTVSTKVLLMSGYQTSDIAPTGRPFIAKPFSINDLARRVRETLDRPSSFARPTKAPRASLVGRTTSAVVCYLFGSHPRSPPDIAARRAAPWTSVRPSVVPAAARAGAGPQ
jgi:hypothetical protein